MPVGSAHRPATPASARAPRVRLSPSPPSGPARVSGGEPSPGLARSLVEVAKTERPPAATRCTRGSRGSREAPPRGSIAGGSREPFQGSCAARFPPSTLNLSRPRCSRPHAGLPVRRSGFDSRWALKNARVADWREAPAFQAGEAGSIPAACSVCLSAGRVGARAGLISRTLSVRFRPLQLGATSWRCSSKTRPARANVSKSTGLKAGSCRNGTRATTSRATPGAERAGRPRVARLQVGGRPVGRPPSAASQA